MYTSLFYLYITSFNCAKKVTYKGYLLLFGLWLIDSIHKLYWLYQTEQARLSYLKSPVFHQYDLISAIAFRIFSVSLFLVTIKVIKKCDTQISPNLYYWVIKVSKVFLVMLILWLINDILLILTFPTHIIKFFKLLIFFALLVTLCWMSFTALQQDNNQKSSLSKEEQLLFQKLETFIQSSEAYLNPSLTQSWLASELNVKPATLSKVITQVTSSNYYTYINLFRLRKFKELLNSEESEILSIEGLAKQSGFGSKTTFYAFFKKMEGVTPKKYQQRIRPSK